MALDPLIALANHPVSTNMPDPLAVQQQRNQLQLQQQALQTGQLQQIGLGQENQMRAQQISDDQNFRQLFNQSMQSGQAPSQAQIMQSLGPVRGAAYNKSMLDVAEAQSRLTKAKDEHAQAENDWAGETANALLKTVGDNGLVDPTALANAVRNAHSLGYEQEAQQLAGLANQNPGAVSQVLTQMVQASNKQRTVNAEETTAQARQTQADNSAARDKQLAGYQSQMTQLTAEREAEQARHNKVMEQQGSQRISQGDTRLDQSQQRIDNSPRAQSTNGLTPGQNQTNYNAAVKEEQKQDGLRQSLGDALQNGLYVMPNGQTVPYEKVIPKQGANEEDDAYQARVQKSTAGLQAEMRARSIAATRAANAATVRKNAAIEGNGGTPDVSNEDAAAARGGQPQTPAQPQKPAGTAQYLKFANDGKGHRLGFNAVTKRWEPVQP